MALHDPPGPHASYRPGADLDVLLVDPGLLTAPYDAALSNGLARNAVRPRWATRHLRLCEEDDLGAAARPIFYPFTDGPRRRQGRVWRAIKGFEHIAGLRALHCLVAKTPTDIVHFQWAMLPRLDIGAIDRLRRIVPVVLTVHDVQPFNGKAVHRLQRDGVERLWHSVDRLIVHTAAGRAALVDKGIDAARVAVIPHGVLGGRTAPVLQRSTDARWRIVLFGRIQAYKGVDVLIEALGLLAPSARARLSVIVAGEPQIDMAPLLRRAIELGIEPATLAFRLRRHSQEEMDDLFAKADAFVFPYRAIEASGVLYEVARLRRWVVASRLGAFVDLLGGADGPSMGELVEPGNATALAHALIASFGKHPAGDISRSVPDWHAIGAQTRAVYLEAIAARRDQRVAAAG